jgi:16S rRNA (uracil1498-N3)-methyltransferase
MSERFFSPHPITAGYMMLDGPEAHHLLHVMRASVGDEVTLFDDSGFEFRATVETLRRADAELRIIERREIDRELPFPLTVGVSLPKGDRQKWLVEKLTELGVTTLVPLITDRSVAQPAAGAVDRLRRSVIEAAKQCGRNRLMKIAPAQPWSDWLNADCGLANDQSAIRNPKSEIIRIVAHQTGASLDTIDPTRSVPTFLAIGPEGGLTDAEVAAATAAGWQLVSLGPRILRVETAAIALAAQFALRSTLQS